MGGKVGRLDVGKIGRFEGGKARKNLMEAYTFHNSFLIPSTQKFFIGDLRSPIFHKIYSPGNDNIVIVPCAGMIGSNFHRQHTKTERET